MQTAYIERNGTLLQDEVKLVQELKERNIPIVYFSNKQLQRNKVIIENPYLVSAGLPSMFIIFSYLGISRPIANSYPIELSDFYKREIKESTLGKAWADFIDGRNYFIKPKNDFKSFTGYVLSDNLYNIDKLLRKLGKDYLINSSSIINIKSEHRAYIADSKLLETSYYFGDDLSLDIKVVERVVDILSTLPNTPSAYAIDFAITDKGETVVLEMNEGFSIDSYKCSSKNYFKVIKTRWDELSKL